MIMMMEKRCQIRLYEIWLVYILSHHLSDIWITIPQVLTQDHTSSRALHGASALMSYCGAAIATHIESSADVRTNLRLMLILISRVM